MDNLEKKLQELIDKEAIRDLMSDYWWLMDTKQWDKWGDVFADDLEFWQMGEKMPITSKEQFLAGMPRSLDSTVTAHQGHQDKIIFTGPDTAEGRFVLEDYLRFKDDNPRNHGWGYYIETFKRCEDGKWRIQKHRLAYFIIDPDMGVDPSLRKLFTEYPYDTEATR